jgi:hypothetical protein
VSLIARRVDTHSSEAVQRETAHDGSGDRHGAPPLRALSKLARYGPPFAALGIGLFSLTTAQASAIGQYGLIQAFPLLYFVSLVILSASFVTAWRGPQGSSAEILLYPVVLVILLQSAPGIIESEPRFPTSWLTAGFTDYVAQTGQVLPGIDARFSWPSFFTGVALLDRTVGLPTSIILIRWWPVFMNLLYLPPFFLLAKTLLRDKKKAMLVVWLFPFANWVGQDYFSPQSTAYLLYLVLLCVVLGPYGTNRRAMIPRRIIKYWERISKRQLLESVGDDWSPQTVGTAITLLVVMLLLCAAIDTGHQITPVFAVGAVAILVFLGRTRLLAWPVLMLLLAAGWICYAAVTYWSGHFADIFGGLSSLSSNYSKDLRLRGNAAHYRIDDVRLLIFGGVWALAAVGFFVGRKMQANRVAAAVLMLTPLVVIAGQDYGGEAGLRAFLFSLPGALCLAVMALTSVEKPRLAFIGVLTALLIPGFMIARWGNESFEMVQPGDVAATNALYKMALPGSTILSITPNVAWQYKDIGQYYYAPNNLDEFAFGSVSGIAALLHNPAGGYVVITRDQILYAQAQYDLPDNWGSGVEQRLEKSHLFRLVYSNSTAEIFRYVGSA